MIVRIKLEDNRPDTNRGGQHWVARDEQRIWHNYAAKHFADSPAAAVAMMYHANEVLSVEDRGAVAIATLAD